MTSEQLEKFGRLLYGDIWITAMARDLSIKSKTVSGWLHGRRKIHPWIAVTLRLIALEKGIENVKL